MPKKEARKLQATNIRTDACFNPFKKISHPKRKASNLRKVNKNQLRALNLSITRESLQQKICDSCRLRINKINEENDDEITNDQVQMVCMYVYILRVISVGMKMIVLSLKKLYNALNFNAIVCYLLRPVRLMLLSSIE